MITAQSIIDQRIGDDRATSAAAHAAAMIGRMYGLSEATPTMLAVQLYKSIEELRQQVNPSLPEFRAYPRAAMLNQRGERIGETFFANESSRVYECLMPGTFVLTLALDSNGIEAVTIDHRMPLKTTLPPR